MQNFGPLREKMPGECFHAHTHTVGSQCVSSMHCDMFQSHFLHTIRWHVSSMCEILKLKMPSVLYGTFLKSVCYLVYFRKSNIAGRSAVFLRSSSNKYLHDAFPPAPCRDRFLFESYPSTILALSPSSTAPFWHPYVIIPQPYSLTFPRSA